ncbi:serine hydrolase [Oscillatoria sp. FACHB-1406]|uniref:serine hydrolase n=1 Tax=Oscillatoria sp. FACHB-1406 TaxID=2692846 RepID=UPI0018F02577|nr:serine hydrolase [Oscillatoria sp. FACHB-1406]
MPQTLSPQAAIARLFTSPQIQSEWFAPSFLSVAPLTQIEEIVKQINGSLGKYREVQQEGDRYLIIFDRGSVPASIHLDEQGRFVGLFFGPPRLNAIRLEDAISQLKTLPGDVSLFVSKNGTEQASLNPERPLAVGSAFKLAILNALTRQIAAGQHQWSEVVALKSNWKSLPTGILQDWPEGSPLTLSTLASLMISISDNTATDALLEVVGRDAVEAFSPHNRPFLSTRAAFILKNPENAALLQRYRQGDETTRRQILLELQSLPLPGVEMFAAGKPLALDVEWFFSTRELCQLMENVAPLPLMQINPGIASPADWKSVAYKGGSEPGVLNFTARVEDEAGQSYCISATWNNKDAIDQTRFQGIYNGILLGLKVK